MFIATRQPLVAQLSSSLKDSKEDHVLSVCMMSLKAVGTRDNPSPRKPRRFLKAAPWVKVSDGVRISREKRNLL